MSRRHLIPREPQPVFTGRFIAFLTVLCVFVMPPSIFFVAVMFNPLAS